MRQIANNPFHLHVPSLAHHDDKIPCRLQLPRREAALHANVVVALMHAANDVAQKEASLVGNLFRDSIALDALAVDRLTIAIERGESLRLT